MTFDVAFHFERVIVDDEPESEDLACTNAMPNQSCASWRFASPGQCTDAAPAVYRRVAASASVWRRGTKAGGDSYL